MFGFLAPIAVPIGTSLITLFSYLFRMALVKWVLTAALFAVITLVGYALADYFLPQWLSIQALRDAIYNTVPSVAYFLDVCGFYDGAPLVFNALGAAWVLKKIPVWAWLGPLLRAKA